MQIPLPLSLFLILFRCLYFLSFFPFVILEIKVKQITLNTIVSNVSNVNIVNRSLLCKRFVCIEIVSVPHCNFN